MMSENNLRMATHRLFRLWSAILSRLSFPKDAVC